MVYVDPDVTHVPTTGDIAPAAWGLVVADDLTAIADQPTADVFASAPQTISNGISETLGADTQRRDTGGMHSTTVNPSRLTVVTPGIYLVWTTVTLDALVAPGGITNNVGRVAFLVDGDVTGGRDTRPLPSNNVTLRISIAATLRLRATQRVEVEVFQNSGGIGQAWLFSFGALQLAR